MKSLHLKSFKYLQLYMKRLNTIKEFSIQLESKQLNINTYYTERIFLSEKIFIYLQNYVQHHLFLFFSLFFFKNPYAN